MTNNNSAPVLTCESVQVNLGGRLVLDDVSIDVAAGSIHGLLGPNGAGKTTLLRTIMGLLSPLSGQVRVNGGVGYVPQRHDVAWDFPITAQQVVMTGLVREIGFFRRPKESHLRAVAKALSRVEMTDLRDRPIGEMSGGQRQRVLIARALAVDPTLLLLDEPFTGLDMPTQELLTGLFEQLAGEGTALLMSTHDLTHAMVVCDQITMLNRRVITQDHPRNLQRPDVWKETFEVSDASPLLKQVGALVC